MPALSLPARANLEFLKKQSKDLRKAFAAGDVEARERIRTHLQRAGGLSDAELRDFELSLQEAQHALACEYGFGKWEDLLAAVVTPRLEDLARLSDREAQILMREVDQVWLVRGLLGAPEPVVRKFLANMSERTKGFIEAEIEFAAQDASPAQREEARQGILRSVLDLREQGWIVWPPPQERPPLKPAPLAPDSLLARVAAPLRDLSVDELADILLALAEQARDLGILSLEACVPAGRGTLLTEAIALCVDGTEPPLVTDLLEVRGATILRTRTLRGQMTIEGWRSIWSGDNPAIVAHKMTSYFVEEPQPDTVPRRRPTADELAARLRDTPLPGMDLETLVEFFRDLAFLARDRKISAATALADHVGDPVLAAGMRATTPADLTGAGPVMEAMAAALQEERAALHQRHSLVIHGIEGIQGGRKPEELVQEARAIARERAQALERLPSLRSVM